MTPAPLQRQSNKTHVFPPSSPISTNSTTIHPDVQAENLGTTLASLSFTPSPVCSLSFLIPSSPFHAIFPMVSAPPSSQPFLLDTPDSPQSTLHARGAFFFFFFKIFIDLFLFYLFLERGEGRKRNINVWLPLKCPLLGTWPATQVYALAGNRTLKPLVHRHSIHGATPARAYLFIFRERGEEGEREGEDINGLPLSLIHISEPTRLS